MEQYINKSALVAEIDRRNVICKKVALDLRTQENKDYYQGKAEAYKEMLDILNTLEVKEADLEKEVANWWKDHYKKIKNDYKFEDYNGHYMENSTIISLAQYFFEFGLKTKGE